MKVAAIATIAALILLSACGSDSTDSDLAVRPVDVWLPLVQVAPPRNIWETYQSQATGSAGYSRLSDASRRQQLFYEEFRIFNFLFPSEPHLLISTSPIVPEILREFLGTYHYLAVLIFHANEDVVAEHLAYIEDFETIKFYFMPRSFNELAEIVNEIRSSDVYPIRWRTTRNVFEGYVRVALSNYSEEEKAFFKEYVHDSPYIRFVCAFED